MQHLYSSIKELRGMLDDSRDPGVIKRKCKGIFGSCENLLRRYGQRGHGDLVGSKLSRIEFHARKVQGLARQRNFNPKDPSVDLSLRHMEAAIKEIGETLEIEFKEVVS